MIPGILPGFLLAWRFGTMVPSSGKLSVRCFNHGGRIEMPSLNELFDELFDKEA